MHNERKENLSNHDRFGQINQIGAGWLASSMMAPMARGFLTEFPSGIRHRKGLAAAVTLVTDENRQNPGVGHFERNGDISTVGAAGGVFQKI